MHHRQRPPRAHRCADRCHVAESDGKIQIIADGASSAAEFDDRIAEHAPVDGRERAILVCCDGFPYRRCGEIVFIFLDEIDRGREAIAREVLETAQARTSDLGIELIDFQIKRINYVEEVRRDVFARMIAELNRIAGRYRSEDEAAP